MHKFKNYSLNDKIFYIVITVILTLFFIMVLYPCIFVISASFSSGTAVQSGKVVLFPVDFSLEGYKTVFHTNTVWIGFRNSLFLYGCRNSNQCGDDLNCGLLPVPA